jgi:hypothetical protein
MKEMARGYIGGKAQFVDRLTGLAGFNILKRMIRR